MNDIISIRKKIISNLKELRLKDVFDELREMVSPLNDQVLDNKLEALETTYRYMIKYMLDGVPDPQREQLYKALKADLYEITDMAVDKHKARTTSSFYYDKRRYYEHSKTFSLAKALEALQKAEDKLSAATESIEAEIPASAIIALRRQVETCQEEIFAQAMVEYPTSDDSVKVAEQLINGNIVGSETACLAVSAITIGALNNYDERKIMLLVRAYVVNGDEEVRQRALCGLVILLYLYRDRVPLSETIRNCVEDLCDKPRFRRDVRNQFVQLIRTLETERISDIFTKEILPEMMKISPGLQNKITNWDKGSETANTPDQNPEWEELLASSGISKRLKELNELQIEGSDVLLTTFSSLKSFPFFSRITNWFRPYNKDNTQIVGAFDGLGNLSEVISASRFMCNSDKYSLALAVTHLPAPQRDMMIRQLPGGKEEAEEVTNNEVDRQASITKNISNQYIQDLYRFFKLAPVSFRNENIFAEHINLPESSLLYPVFDDKETQRLIGEYYLKKKYYGYAEKYFEKLSQQDSGDAILYQKTGYCKQMQKNYEGAIKEYIKADMLSPDFWTLHHLAASYRAAGRISDALKYYKEALALRPDDLTMEMQCGHCHLALGQYEEALKHYYKVEYLSDGNIKSWRPLAWCLFLTGKIQQAENYYKKILSGTPTGEDYLNAGHTAFAARQYTEACDRYKKSLKMQNEGFDKFYKAFTQDKEILQKNGVPADEIAIMLDYLEYTA